MNKKHRAVSADSYDDEETDIERNSYMYIPKTHDSVDDEFSRIQEEDMASEKLNDRRQQVLNAQREHDAFMRRLDKKGLSAVTHDKDKTELDVISNSIESKEKMERPHKKKAAKHAESQFDNHQLSQSESELNLDSYNEEAINQIQAQIESRVQKDLESLATIANNKYGKGKRVYDYQLVRLSDGERKLEKEALEKADELYYKHSNLNQKVEDMTSKFSVAEKTLNEYKSQFYKDKSRLQQDHDSFVKIKEATEKDLKE